MVNGFALVLCLGYMYKMGWYMSVSDVIWVVLDEILLVLMIGSIVIFGIIFFLMTFLPEKEGK